MIEDRITARKPSDHEALRGDIGTEGGLLRAATEHAESFEELRGSLLARHFGVGNFESPVSLDDSSLRERDRKSTRLNSSHLGISSAVFCLNKKQMRRT